MSSSIETNTHNYRNVYISFKGEVRSTDVETYLKRHLSEFYKKSRFIVLCGIHSFPTGDLGHTEAKFVVEYHSMFTNVKSDFNQQCQKKCGSCKQCQKFTLWNEKDFEMGTVVPVFSIFASGKYVLMDSCVTAINSTINDLFDTKLPHVFIFATCYSLRSEINQLFCSRGLFSVLTISKDRGDITCGKIFQLTEEQKSFLKEIINNPQIKDIILFGK